MAAGGIPQHGHPLLACSSGVFNPQPRLVSCGRVFRVESEGVYDRCPPHLSVTSHVGRSSAFMRGAGNPKILQIARPPVASEKNPWFQTHSPSH